MICQVMTFLHSLTQLLSFITDHWHGLGMERVSQILQHSQQAGFGGASRRRNQHLPFARSARER
jgi:hypothetical protein